VDVVWFVLNNFLSEDIAKDEGSNYSVSRKHYKITLAYYIKDDVVRRYKLRNSGDFKTNIEQAKQAA